MAQPQGFDGSEIKQFVEDDSTFQRYVDKTFNSLDTNHTGTVSEKDLEPIIQNLGQALGLPPKGESKESDHIYDEIFAEFQNEKGVTKQTFAKVLKEVYLGLADGLERDPIDILSIDGSQLRAYAESGAFDTDTVATFTRIDVEAENRLPAAKLVDALKAISVSKGMPPADDAKMKGLVSDALAGAQVNTDDSLDQFQFSDILKRVVLFIADGLQKDPVQVAHSEKVFDGKSIVAFLKDETVLHQCLDETWEKMPKDKKGKCPRTYLRVGLDELCPAAGLPPVDSVDEMDSVLTTVFSKIDANANSTVTKEEFEKTMLEILGSLMLQLDGKPITVNNSRIIEDSPSTLA